MAILKGAIDALTNATKTTWNKPITQQPKRIPKTHSIPNAREFELPILLTNFQKWSDTPYPPISSTTTPKWKSTLKGLDTNIFAQMLATPCRMDKLTRSILPADLLIKLAHVQNNKENKFNTLFTPLFKKDGDNNNNVKGPRGYISLTQQAIEAMGKRHKQVQEALTEKNPIIGEWNNKIDYHKMLLKEIEPLLTKLKESSTDSLKYKINFNLNVHINVELKPTTDTIAQFNIAKLINENIATKWKQIVGKDEVTIDASSNTRNESMRLVNLLWRYKLYSIYL